MPSPAKLKTQDLLACGLAENQAESRLKPFNRALEHTGPSAWSRLQLLLNPADPFPLHKLLYEAAYAEWPANNGPAPAWLPDEGTRASSNLWAAMQKSGHNTYEDFFAWSVEHRVPFWRLMLEQLHLGLGPSLCDDPTPTHAPNWFPDTRYNIAAACFAGPRSAPALVYSRPDVPLARMSYGDLYDLSMRVAHGVRAMDLPAQAPIAVVLPMTPEAVAIYLGIILAGAAVVGIADSFAADEIGRRLRLSGAKAVFCQSHLRRGVRFLPLYERLQEAEAPMTVVLSPKGAPDSTLRPQDQRWEVFLPAAAPFEPVLGSADATTNILFSSGTTGDPKAIPWDQTTPLKCAVDGHLLQDIRPGDTVAWPTSLGWMMGPWLIYASLLNGATIALYHDQPTGNAFCRFVEEADVSILGCVPSLVRAWRRSASIESCDWSGIRLFSSTGECSDPEDMLYLMAQAGYKPIIEYCGGTEIGGAYISSTLLQPNAPSCFSTPTPGLDLVLFDDNGSETDAGEALIIPPSIGLSSTLLNRDHYEVYYAETPAHPRSGGQLRRHGDRLQRLPGGYFRAEGRADDTMNLGGIKISAAEIERTLNPLPGISETAAVAVPPPGGGPDALVVFAVAQACAAELLPLFRRTIRQQLNPLFLVHAVEVVESLPRTASNKVMRRVLRDNFISTHKQQSK